MASQAYLKALKEVPKDIQDDVIGSLNIANEIHDILTKKDIKPAELARRLDKSESEISKWLTGLHNFTFKTVRKIERALDSKIIVTNSSKINSYELRLNVMEDKIRLLESSVENKERPRKYYFKKRLELSHLEQIGSAVRAGVFFIGSAGEFTFNQGIKDSVRIQPETSSRFSYHKLGQR